MLDEGKSEFLPTFGCQSSVKESTHYFLLHLNSENNHIMMNNEYALRSMGRYLYLVFDKN